MTKAAAEEVSFAEFKRLYPPIMTTSLMPFMLLRVFSTRLQTFSVRSRDEPSGVCNMTMKYP